MLRANYKALVLLPAILTGLVACGVEDADDDPYAGAEAVLSDQAAESTTAPSILGTFRNESAPLGIAVLTLKANFTYHKQEALVCVRYPCIGPQTNGRYKLIQQDGSSVLLLMPEGGVTERYDFLLKGDTLYLEKFGEEPQTLQRSECAWCAVANDCALQDLDRGPCAGEWSCASNTCDYVCRGMTAPPKEASSCSGVPDSSQ